MCILNTYIKPHVTQGEFMKIHELVIVMKFFLMSEICIIRLPSTTFGEKH